MRRLAAAKPVVAQVGTLAASAGYMIASAADHIVARKSSIVGSIGVLVQFPDVTGLMDKLGVKLEEVKSSPLKAEPSPFNPTTEEERAMIRAHDPRQLRLVRRPRRRAPAADAATRSRRWPTARSSPAGRRLTSKLVDELGGEQEAVGWLATQGRRRQARGGRVEAERRAASAVLLRVAGQSGRQLLGLPEHGGDCSDELGADRLFLDGLLSVWHPEKAVWGD